MAALDFPSDPSVDQIYTANGSSWKWDGVSWRSVGVPILPLISDVILNATDLSVLDTVPFVLIPAPGIGKIIIPINFSTLIQLNGGDAFAPSGPSGCDGAVNYEDFPGSLIGGNVIYGQTMLTGGGIDNFSLVLANIYRYSGPPYYNMPCPENKALLFYADLPLNVPNPETNPITVRVHTVYSVFPF